MIPVLAPTEMKAVDDAAPEPVETLVARAGAVVGRAALLVLGGAYGRRVVVVAGKGNNGADGREAARRLREHGVRVAVVEATGSARRLPPSDLVVDAAYGTGFRGDYEAPDPGGAPVLAVDIPSGVDGATGRAGPGAVRADLTITFAALKPGLMFSPGYDLAGRVEVADIGLDVSSARMGLLQRDDVAAWRPARARDAHKWQTAVWVVAGSPGMTGAGRLCATAALRAGAGVARLGTPGCEVPEGPVESVGRALPAEGWDGRVLEELDRMKALVIGPGLGRSEATASAVRATLAAAPVPAVVDADALYALGDSASAAGVIGRRRAPTVLTPHAGEFARLAGAPAGDDPIGAARRLAAATGAVVLLKGSTTVVADPGGEVLLTASGDARLATSGSGDVLTGVIGAFLAVGLGPLRAASAAAYVHGASAHLGWRRGLVAGDLLEHLPSVLTALW